MTFPVLVEAQEGRFAASLVGAPNVRVVEPTRAQAIAAIRSAIQQRIELGELLSLEIETIGVSSLAGEYRDDPTLSEIRDQAYQLRDAERDR